MSLKSMLSALSSSEKLEAMDILWQELSVSSKDYVSPDWHADVLQKRLDSPSPLPVLSLDEAIKVVRARVDANRADR